VGEFDEVYSDGDSPIPFYVPDPNLCRSLSDQISTTNVSRP
jgi:hypothetical protein